VIQGLGAPIGARIPRRSTGARHWAIVASLVATAKLNGVEPWAWLTDVLERMVSGRIKAHELERLLPWAWQAERLTTAVHA
jgi:transposase